MGNLHIIVNLLVGEFDLQSVLRSCIPAPPTGCNPDYVQTLLNTPVDPTIEIRNADGTECYCSTNNCNDQTLDSTPVTVAPAVLNCVSCVSLDFGDPFLDAEFRSLSCEDAVIDGLNVIQTACAATDNHCVTVSASMESAGLPPFSTVLRSCASSANQGCLDANLIQSTLEAVLGFAVTNIAGTACYCQGNFCNDAPVQPGTPGENICLVHHDVMQ
ncbi:hypothetical protein HOLleu_28610 [Holothuria leucospilota]|uniref:Uncharacterized protein n=1 Tax=Holothuria leucospilota TaxID=206669 RepID=A0A9Q1BMD6_HOLLE|nr:hypothetical protein HOLleu_28610 [Holothuria leucospilota]